MARRPIVASGVAVLVAVISGAIADGMFIVQQIRKVPVERLARNLEEQINRQPDAIELRLNLARVYSMAYTLKATELEATGSDRSLTPWFGHTRPHLPPSVTSPASRESRERAAADLSRAVKAYEDVVARDPSNAIGQLGYGWVLEQSGDRTDAITAYRRAIEAAWPKERAEQGFWAGQDPITTEASNRLLQLLDPQVDAKELASLREKQQHLEKAGRMVTPIAIPIATLTDYRNPAAASARVVFDADGSGIPRAWSWIGSDAGWLVHDPDGDGRITSALQLFGNVTFWLFWKNGYHALEALDDDGDGELRGRELAQLAIWHDRNQNGVSERGEVRPLSAHGVVALSCRYQELDDPWLAAASSAGATFADGTTRPTFDVILRSAQVRGQAP